MRSPGNHFFIFPTAIFFLLLVVASTNAQFPQIQNQLNFKKINVKDGLSQASVNCFYEDIHGFMWIGTDDGLNRYDGSKFTVFKADAGSTSGLSSSQIWAIEGDPAGNIWIATAEGLNYLNIQSNEIVHYVDSGINNYFTDLIYDNENQRIWLAANAGGIKCFNLTNHNFIPQNDSLLRDLVVWSLLKKDNDELLLGTLNSGIYLFNIGTSALTPYLTEATKPVKLPSNTIRSMVCLDDELIVGMEGGGVMVYNHQAETSRIINTTNSALSSDQVFSMALDRNHLLWLGTDGGGLNMVDMTNDKVTTHRHIDTDDRSISSDVIRTIFMDSKQNKWFGTYNAGINFVNWYSKNLYHLTKSYGQKYSLNGKIVNTFAEDGKGGLWVGLDKSGLDHYLGGVISNIGKGTSERSLNDDVIMSLINHPDGTLYIGTFRGGLNIYRDGIIEKYQHNATDPHSISADLIWDMTAGPDGNIWLGTAAGLSVFNGKTKQFRNYYPAPVVVGAHSRNSVRSLYFDDAGFLWIGTFAGFGKFNTGNESFDFFIGKSDNLGLSNEIIIKIIRDRKGRIWLCTYGGGLNLFNEKEKTFRVFSESDGLPGNLVQSIEEDDNGILWVSTIKGLGRFDPEAGEFQILNESSGLQSDIFMRQSSFRMKNGNLLFGGINGFNVFHPDSIKFPALTGEIQVTGFHVYSRSVEEKNPGKITNITLSQTQEVEINYRDSRFFTVNFTIPDFFQPELIRFSYKLEGFDQRWNDIGMERKATFTNLNPGEYVLNIKASLNSNLSMKQKQIRIVIVPPFYMTKSFLLFAVILLGSGVFGFVRYRTAFYQRQKVVLEKMVAEKSREINFQYDELRVQHQKLSKAQEALQKVNSTLEEKVRKRTKKLNLTIDKLNKSVTELDRFVYSASHDLSAPLKSIKGLVNIARLDDKESVLKVHLNYIEQSILKLENVIQDLIQFSRNSRTKVIYEEVNLSALVREAIFAFQYLQGYANITIDIQVPDNTNLISDRQRVQMLLHNMLSNAIKYSDVNKAQKLVLIQYTQNESEWTLVVKDNGIGIGDEHLEKVFDMFYRATELSDGTGLGLFIVKEAVEKLNGRLTLESKLGEGSVVTLTFPKVQLDEMMEK